MSIQQPTSDSTASTPRPTTQTTPSDPDSHEAWVARCQSQFDARSTGRLHNLADEENWFAMGEGDGATVN